MCTNRQKSIVDRHVLLARSRIIPHILRLVIYKLPFVIQTLRQCLAIVYRDFLLKLGLDVTVVIIVYHVVQNGEI